MPNRLGLSVTVNHSQKRIALYGDRQWVVASGTDFSTDSDINLWEDTWIDPICNRLMLRPSPLYEEFWKTNVGNYVKLGKADFTFATPADWVEDERFPGGGKFIVAQGVHEPGITVNALGVNQPVAIGIHLYSDGSDTEIARWGWNNTADISAGVGFVLYSGGGLDLYKNGQKVGSYKIGVKTNDLTYLMMIPCGGAVKPHKTSDPPGTFMSAMRELLVCTVTEQGQTEGFSHVFADIDEHDATAAVLPAAKFWVDFSADGNQQKAHFQVALIKFPTFGYATTRMLSFPEQSLVPIGGVLGRFFYGFTKNGTHPAPVVRLMGPSGTAGYTGATADGAGHMAYLCRLRVELSSTDGTYTPTMYGTEAFYDAVAAYTPSGSEFLLDDYILEATLQVPEDRQGAQVTLVIKKPHEVDLATGLLSLKNVPVRVKLSENSTTTVDDNDVVIMDGRTHSVEWHTEVGDDVQRAKIVIREPWKALEHYYFQDHTPHDGRELSEAIAFDLGRIGLRNVIAGSVYTEHELELETTSFILGATPSKDANDFNVLVEAGHTAAQDLCSLIEDNAAGWFARFVPHTFRTGDVSPNPRFKFKSPTTLSGEPIALTVYGTRAAAIAAGLADDDQLWKFLYRSFKHETLEPEGNDIRITWLDPRDGKIKQERKVDNLAIDPSIPRASRPDNWVGEVRRVGIASDKITRQDVAQAALQYLYDRVTPKVTAGEIECEMLFWPDAGGTYGRPVWVGDKLGTDTDGDLTVCAMEVHFFREPGDEGIEPDPVHWREAHYVLGDGSGNFSGGTRLSSIKQANEVRAAKYDKFIVRPRMREILRQTPKAVTNI